MALSSDWVEAEIARQLELVSIELEDDSEGEADGEESIHQQVRTLHGATPPVAVAMVKYTYPQESPQAGQCACKASLLAQG